MKKILLIATTVLALSGLSSMGQGYVAFQTPTRGTWDLFTPANAGVPKLAATMNIAFLWASSGPALITSLGATTPTNNLASQPVFTPAQAWNAILNDPNYHLGVDGNTSTSPILANAANGSASYNSAASFPLVGSAAGSTISVYVIGWDKTYATPALAAANNAKVGWSGVFSYNTGASSIATVSTFAASGFVPFGVPGVVPEPGTFAIAGLGLASMLIARRRK